MKDYTAPPTTQPAHRVTVVRILREWSEADSTPFAPDELDAMVFRAAALARLRPA